MSRGTTNYMLIENFYSEVEAVYVDTKIKLRGKLAEKLEVAQAALGTAPALLTDSSFHVDATSSPVPQPKIPKFSGKHEDWDSFKELFCSLIKNDRRITPVRKLQLLLTGVEGDAARRLANFQVNGDNFEVAWQTLERKYDNKRLRLSMQINRMLSMTPATSTSVSEINRLLDTTTECRRALQVLGRPVEHWDDWFVQIVVRNLDRTTCQDWEKSLEGIQTFPTYDTLVHFLEHRTHSLDTADCNEKSLQPSFKQKPHSSHATPKRFANNHKNVSAHLSSGPAARKDRAPKSKCIVCNGNHYIGHCPTLLQKDPAFRRETTDGLRLCRNCLQPRHLASACTSKYRCRLCQPEHHSILHIDAGPRQQVPPTVQPTSNPQTASSQAEVTSTSVHSYATTSGSTTLLATAQVVLCSGSGELFPARALIDPCAEGSFITEKVVQALSLRKVPLLTTISGVGAEVTATSSFSATLTLKSKTDPAFRLAFSAAVLSRLTQLLPRRAVSGGSWHHLRGLQLADPDFEKPAPIDCILGGDLFPALLLDGVCNGPSNTPVAQNTRLGWILTGPTHRQTSNISAFSTILSVEKTPSTSELLRRFWEVEEISTPPPLTPEDEACERHFERTHQRNDEGRYVVRLPFRDEPILPGSHTPALHRLILLERKLQRDDQLRQDYGKFLHDYERLQHMVVSTGENNEHEPAYFLPHHAVIKQDGSRKIRVVFDASQAAANGKSLNYFLHTGPKLQLDITTVLTRWRQFQYVFTADIVKMFRQILIQQDDTIWQQILWRASLDQSIQTFRLLTVTYGTACAPYLAIKVLRQLAEDEGERFPLGAQILRSHIYVDDALAGGDSVDEARQARAQLEGILHSAGMQLDKWAANVSHILPGSCFSKEDVTFQQEEVVSTLGLRWSPQSDQFHFKVQRRSHDGPATKRAILRDVARLYDPLGWLAPVTVRAKVLLQLLWITGKD